MRVGWARARKNSASSVWSSADGGLMLLRGWDSRLMTLRFVDLSSATQGVRQVGADVRTPDMTLEVGPCDQPGWLVACAAQQKLPTRLLQRLRELLERAQAG